MAGFMYFKAPEGEVYPRGEVTQGGRPDWPSPNGMGKANWYRNWIELISITETVSRPIETGRSGTARARSGTVMEDIEVEKEVDRTSTFLLEACAGGKSYAEVFLHICTSLGDRLTPQQGAEGMTPEYALHPYMEFHMFAVKVTSYTINASALNDGAIPTETLQLNFDKILWRYWPIGPIPEQPDVPAEKIHDFTGSGWDIVKATKFMG
jgi:type VI protein secretion system component Hcp